MNPEIFRKHHLLFWILLLFPISLFAEVEYQHNEINTYVTNNISVENQNWNISQDPSSGVIYFANSDGLVAYNGISKKVYHLPHRKIVRSVMSDNKGNVFTGSFEEFGFWNTDQQGHMGYHSLVKNFKVEKNDEIWKIYELDGTVYFQSFTTIYKYDYKTVSAVKSPFTMLFLFKLKNRFMVEVMEHGLYWFDGSRFDFVSGSEIFKDKKVHSIIPGTGGSLLICTASHGIYTYENNKFTNLQSPLSAFLQTYSCNAGLSINDSIKVFGTILNGIVFSNNQGQILKHFNFSNGLNNNTVLSLFRDKENGLWMGLDEGVNYIDVFSPYTYYANVTGTLGTIYTVLKEKNKLYMGTNHGLFVADITQKNGNFDFSNIRLIPGSQGQVWTLEKFDGQILCGHNEGTFILENDVLRRISTVTGGWCFRPYNDFLLEGTYTGIVVFKKDEHGKWKFRNKIKYFDEPTRHLEVDYRGFIWTSHLQRGVYKLEINESLDSVLKTDYFNIVHDKPFKSDVFKIRNSIAFTTLDSICTYDYEIKCTIPFKSINTVMGDYMQSSQIIPYGKDTYWFINSNKIGLFEISKNFVVTKILDLLQKPIDIPEHETRIIHLDEYNLLIPTREAFSVFNMKLQSRFMHHSNLQIKELMFQGKENIVYFSPAKTSFIRAPYQNNNLTVSFADASHFNIEEREFYYKIQEIDENWHKTRLDNFSYLNLPYGNYTLLIRQDSDNSITRCSFTILHPWYLTKQAYACYFVFFLLFIYAGYRIFRAELNKQRKLIEFEIGKKKLESELDYKSYELMLTMRYLIQKNEILTELQEHVNSIKDFSSKYPIKSIRDMERIITEGLQSQTEEWGNAMNSLKLSQQGFFKLLKHKHPELTPHDLRLCSYLRMNFTTKEIAKLLNITIRGVEISRYRLRRKMNLEHEINLSEYLINEAVG